MVRVEALYLTPRAGGINIRAHPLLQQGLLCRRTPVHPALNISTNRLDSIGTFGSIYRISAEDEKMIFGALSSSYIRLSREVFFLGKIEYPPKCQRGPLQTLIHFDPRNTADGCNNLWGKDNEMTPERMKDRRNWGRGLMQLRVFGVPEWYTQKLHSQLNGNAENAEPLFGSAFEFNTLPQINNFHHQRRHIQGRQPPSRPQSSRTNATVSGVMSELVEVGGHAQYGRASPSSLSQHPANRGSLSRAQKRKPDASEVDRTVKYRRGTDGVLDAIRRS